MSEQNLLEIRIHGRGGQGVVTAAELLALAASHNKKYAQAFPFFGVERNGAPIEAYCRISDRPIRLRSQVYSPEILIIQDESLIEVIDVFKGMTAGKIIINSTKDQKSWRKKINRKGIVIYPIDATKIALKYLGKPIVNTAIIGAFAAATKILQLDLLKNALSEKFPAGLVEPNWQAMTEAYHQINHHLYDE